MVVKKSSRTNSHSRKKLAQDLARQEGSVKNMGSILGDGNKFKFFPKLIPALVCIVALAIVGVVAVLQTQQQNLINENRQQFIAVRNALDDIRDSNEFSATDTTWVRGEQCEYNPGKFELTYKARTLWQCWASIEREVIDGEEVNTLQEQLVDAISTQDAKRLTKTTLLTPGGLSCYARLITITPRSEGNREPSSVGLNCSGSAYKSWYPNNGQRTTVQGSNAWRSLE